MYTHSLFLFTFSWKSAGKFIFHFINLNQWLFPWKVSLTSFLVGLELCLSQGTRKCFYKNMQGKGIMGNRRSQRLEEGQTFMLPISQRVLQTCAISRRIDSTHVRSWDWKKAKTNVNIIRNKCKRNSHKSHSYPHTSSHNSIITCLYKQNPTICTSVLIQIY